MYTDLTIVIPKSHFIDYLKIFMCCNFFLGLIKQVECLSASKFTQIMPILMKFLVETTNTKLTQPLIVAAIRAGFKTSMLIYCRSCVGYLFHSNTTW